MNRYQNDPPADEPDEPETPLGDPNADEPDSAELGPAWAPEPEPTTPTAAAPPVPAGSPSLPDAATLAQQNELLRQQAVRAQQAAQQAAANQVQTWLAAQPPEKQVEYRRIIEDQMREAEDKRRVMWTIAQREGLTGQHLQDFYEEAQAITDPYTMEKVGQRFKRWQEYETKGAAAVATKPKPGMATIRPDAGAPQGNRANNNRRRREELLAPFRPGGEKQGKLVELEMMLDQQGFYG